MIFDQAVRSRSGLSADALPKANELLFDSFYDVELDRWTPWERLLPPFQYDRTKRFAEIFVPTIDTIRLGRREKLVSVDRLSRRFRMAADLDAETPSTRSVRRRNRFE